MTAKFIPGVGQAFLGDIPAVKKVLHVSYGVSSANPDVVASDIGVVNLVDITVPVVIFGAWVQTEEAWTTSVTGTIGDTGGADRYFADTTINMAASGAILIASTGLTIPYVDPLGLNVDVTIGGATAAAGLTHVYIEYAELVD